MMRAVFFLRDLVLFAIYLGCQPSGSGLFPADLKDAEKLSSTIFQEPQNIADGISIKCKLGRGADQSEWGITDAEIFDRIAILQEPTYPRHECNGTLCVDPIENARSSRFLRVDHLGRAFYAAQWVFQFDDQALPYIANLKIEEDMFFEFKNRFLVIADLRHRETGDWSAYTIESAHFDIDPLHNIFISGGGVGLSCEFEL